MQIISWIPVFVLFFDSITASVLVYLMPFYFHLRLDEVNQKLKDLLLSKKLNQNQISMSVKSLIAEHNQICVQISNSNKFWKQIYLNFVLIAIPMNICFTHQFLFESFELYVQFYFGLTVFLELIVIFLFQYLTASVSTKIHKSAKYLARIQRNITKRSLFCLRIKLKLLIYFERLRSNRKIGFAIGSLAVMTLPLFYRVIKINNLFKACFQRN
jgi:hypothetical protein